MDAELFIPFTFFAFLTAVIVVPVLAKERTKRSAHDLISQAMARGQVLDPSLVSQLTTNMIHEGDRARKSLGNGVVLLALAAGFVAAGYVASGFDNDAGHGMMIPAIIMGSVGLSFVILAIFDYSVKKRDAA